MLELTRLPFDETKIRMRALLFIGVAIVGTSCRTDAQLDPIQTPPIIDAAEINAREDCLSREVARLLEPKGRSQFQLLMRRTSRETIKSRQNIVPSPSVWNYARKGQMPGC